MQSLDDVRKRMAPTASANGHVGRAPAPPARTLRPVEDYSPFPSHLLPSVVRPFVRETAQAIGCDEVFVGIPALVACAAAIGNSRRVELKRGWAEPSVIWAAMVGESGSRKSPPFRAAMRPLVQAEERFRDEYQDEKRRHEQANKERPHGAEKPAGPKQKRVLTEDVTIESVALLLVDNPRGVVNGRDEIEDWFQSLTRYKGKAGGTDRARWLKLSNADTLIVDRKTGDPAQRSIFVARAICSIVGTIQPGVLAACLDHLARQSGLAARLLLARPDYRVWNWTDNEVRPEAEEGYGKLVRGLLELTMTADARNRPLPHTLVLTHDAKEIWVKWFNEIQGRKGDAESDRRAVLAKLEGYAARFALIYHVAERVAAGGDALDPVSAEAMTSGTQLAEWFILEAQRIYATLDETDDDRGTRDLLNWIRQRGGRCSARELQRARGGTFPSAPAAEQALDVLRNLGLGTWQEKRSPNGGHTVKEFVLLAPGEEMVPV